MEEAQQEPEAAIVGLAAGEFEGAVEGKAGAGEGAGKLAGAVSLAGAVRCGRAILNDSSADTAGASDRSIETTATKLRVARGSRNCKP